MDVYGLLFFGDGGGGFDGDAQGDGLSGGDAAGDAAAVVGLEFAVFHVVVGLAAAQFGEGESVADFDAFECADGHQRVGEPCVQFGEYRVADAYRYPRDVELDDAAEAVLFAADIEDGLFHFFGRFGVRTAHDVLFDDRVVAGFGFDGADFDGVGVEFDALTFKNVHRHGTSGNTGGSFAGRATSSPSMIAQAVFFVEGEVRVAGSKEVFDVVVRFAELVLVFDEEGDGCARGFPVEYARENFDRVFFFTLRHDFGLPRSTAFHLFKDRVLVDGDARSQAVHDAADGRAV